VAWRHATTGYEIKRKYIQMYSLLTIIATPNKESGIIEQNIIMTTLLITFDKQTKVGTLKVTGENMIIPQHEVKEFNQRYAIIVFTGVVPVGLRK